MLNDHQWYSIRTRPGREVGIKALLEQRLDDLNLDHMVSEIFYPQETNVTFTKKGKESKKTRAAMPGYMFIHCWLTPELYNAVKATAGVMHFVTASGGNAPVPMSNKDVDKMKRFTAHTEESPQIREPFSKDDKVVIVGDHPFVDFTGDVLSVDMRKQKLSVEVQVLGRKVPTEVPFAQAKIAA